MLERLRAFLGLATARREGNAANGAWCLVANVTGTKHFRPGTKVYCLPPQWGDGYENVIAVGLARRPRRLITIVLPRTEITNWRAKVVYEPAVLQRLREGFDGFNAQWRDRAQVERMVASLMSTS